MGRYVLGFHEIDQTGAEHVKIADVLRKGRFMRDRFRFSVRHDLAIVDPVGQTPIMFARRAKDLLKLLESHLPKLSDGLDSETREGPAGHLADAPNPTNGQRIEKRLPLSFFDHDQAVRLLEVAGNLRQKLVGRDPDGSDESNFLANPCLDLLADQGGRPEERLARGDIEERFIERERFDKGCEVLEDRSNLPRDRRIMVHSRLHEHRVRAELSGPSRGHRAVDAELSRRVVRGRDDATSFRGSTNDDRLADEGRIIAFFDGRLERVHIDMEDHGLFLVFQAVRRLPTDPCLKLIAVKAVGGKGLRIRDQ